MKKIKVKLYFEEFEVEVDDDENILNAIMREGYDPPFSCQIGACSSCKAKLEKGKVTMDEDEALTQSEIDDGYILTCQSHPLTDDCIIDYDF